MQSILCWNNTSDPTSSGFCLGPKCHVVGHDLTSLWILHDWWFTRSEFHRSASQWSCFKRESARNIIAGGGGDAISSGANRGERWWTAWLRLGLGSGFRRSERWRWDKQCQRPSEHPVIHGSVWIIRERLTLSTRSAEMFLCVRLGG